MIGATRSNLMQLRYDHIDDNDAMRELIKHLRNSDNDFEVHSYRFILAEDIDEIMQEELQSDEYMLGCFYASFLADILNVTAETIEKMQKADAFEGIGQWIIDAGKVPELQQEYVSADSYGHYFSHYDGEEHEIKLLGDDYYYFRLN